MQDLRKKRLTFSSLTLWVALIEYMNFFSNITLIFRRYETDLIDENKDEFDEDLDVSMMRVEFDFFDVIIFFLIFFVVDFEIFWVSEEKEEEEEEEEKKIELTLTVKFSFFKFSFFS